MHDHKVHHKIRENDFFSKMSAVFFVVGYWAYIWIIKKDGLNLS